MSAYRTNFALVAFAALAVGCTSANNESSPTTPSQPSSEAAGIEPTTTGLGSAAPPTTQRGCLRADVVEVGDCIEVDTNGAIYLGDDVYVATRPIVAYPGRLWERSDFPAEWDVEILNEAPTDGDDWIIRNVHAKRIDERTLEVVEPVTGDLIGTFLRDERPPEERPLPG